MTISPVLVSQTSLGSHLLVHDTPQTSPVPGNRDGRVTA